MGSAICSQSFRRLCCFYLSQPLSVMSMHSFTARKNYQYMVQTEQHWQQARNELSILLSLLSEATTLCPPAYSWAFSAKWSTQRSTGCLWFKLSCRVCLATMGTGRQRFTFLPFCGLWASRPRGQSIHSPKNMLGAWGAKPHKCEEGNHRSSDGLVSSLILVGLKSQPASKPTTTTTSYRKPSCISQWRTSSLFRDFLSEHLALYIFLILILIIDDHISPTLQISIWRYRECLAFVSSTEPNTIVTHSRWSLLREWGT